MTQLNVVVQDTNDLLGDGARWALVESGRGYIARWMPAVRENMVIGNALSLVADEAAKQGALLALTRALTLVRSANGDAAAGLQALQEAYAAVVVDGVSRD